MTLKFHVPDATLLLGKTVYIENKTFTQLSKMIMSFQFFSMLRNTEIIPELNLLVDL